MGGTLRLLEAARAAGVKRFLQVSTDEVYGSLGPTGAFEETTPLAPRSPYSASKAAADHLVMAFHHTHGMDTVITRCSNNYGPYQFPEKLIPLMILNAFDGQPLPVYGDGLYVRDWIHVDDHCEAIDAVLTARALGRGLQHRRRQRAAEPGRRPRDPAPHGPGRIADPPRPRSPGARSSLRDERGQDPRAELGWAPRHVFDDGAGRDRRLVSRQQRLEGTASAAARIATTTSVSTRAGSRKGDYGLGGVDIISFASR